jgi:hypothetical protein
MLYYVVSLMTPGILKGCNSYSFVGHGVPKEICSPSEIQETQIQTHSTPKLAGNVLLVPQSYMPVGKFEIRKYLFKLFPGKSEIKCQNNFETL